MRRQYLDGLALGVTLGFIASTVLFWAWDDTTGVVQQHLSEQITHIVTLFAAVLALFGISKQIQSNVELSEAARQARLDAARATLPIVLSNISTLAEERIYALVNGNVEPEPGVKWEFSDVELNTLKECIEHSTGLEKKLMLQICRVYQVLIVRWEALEPEDLFFMKKVSDGDLSILNQRAQFGALTNWATLKAICNSLFDYARGEESSPDVDAIKDNVISILEWLNSGGRAGSGGRMLTNNVDFRRYLESLDSH